MDQIMDVAICSGLDISHPHIKSGLVSDSFVKSVQNQLPEWWNKCFGVFVTVHRSADKLSDWPKDIHGCIGYWDDNLQVLSPAKIIHSIVDVSYKATQTDDRRSHFPPLDGDTNSRYEINFMLLPILPVDTNTGHLPDGQVFDNHSYGLIATSDGSRATYLPKVFPDSKGWNSIRDDLVNKAGSGVNADTFTFQAYKTHVWEKTIAESGCHMPSQLGGATVTSLADQIKDHFVGFINHYYLESGNLAYLVEAGGRIISDDSQDVRNLATIADLVSPNLKQYLDNQVEPLITEVLHDYQEKFTNNPEGMRQASAFLLLAMYFTDISSSFQDQIMTYLYQHIDELEPRFELGEVVIALKRVGITTKSGDRELRLPILQRQQVKMYQRINKPEFTLDDIFEYNWQSKYLLALCQKPDAQDSKLYRSHITLLAERIIELSSRMLTNTQTETNYLAVAFEALSSLYSLLEKPSSQTTVGNYIVNLFRRLMERYQRDTGLFYFISGQARIDITGHVLGGIYALPDTFLDGALLPKHTCQP